METIQPLPRRIVNRAKELGVTVITLNFSGGSDEGYLNVRVNGELKRQTELQFIGEIEEWAWNAYSYSGAGDGSDYGDDIEYDLKNGTASCSEWYTSRVEGESSKSKFKISDDE